MVRKILLPIMVSLFLYSCITTKINSYVDNDFSNKQYSSIIVRVEHPDFEFREYIADSIIKELSKHSIISHLYLDLFPPTRIYSDEERLEQINKLNADAHLLVSVVSENSNNVFLGNYSSTYVTWNNYSATGTQFTSPIMVPTRTTLLQYNLWDIKTQLLCSTGEIKTKAEGSIYMSDKQSATSIGKKIVEELKDNNLIRIED